MPRCSNRMLRLKRGGGSLTVVNGPANQPQYVICNPTRNQQLAIPRFSTLWTTPRKAASQPSQPCFPREPRPPQRLGLGENRAAAEDPPIPMAGGSREAVRRTLPARTGLTESEPRLRLPPLVASQALGREARRTRHHLERHIAQKRSLGCCHFDCAGGRSYRHGGRNQGI